MKWLIAIALLALTACTITPHQDSDTIKIGAIFMLTGLGNVQGEHSTLGVQLAIDQINQQGGINGKQLELIVEDNKGDNPKEAISAYRKLKAQGINIILGPNWSPSAEALAPIACADQTLMIAPSVGIAEFNKECSLLFSLWPPDYLNSQQLGQYVVEQGHKNIVIISSTQVWEHEQGIFVKKGVDQAGGSAELLITTRETKDFSNEALKAADADAVVFTNYAFQHLTAKQLREQGNQAIFYGVVIEPYHIQGAQGAFEDAIAITSFTPNNEFINSFTQKYNKEPLMPADTSYDSIMLLAEAMQKTNSQDPLILSQNLNTITHYAGASGSLTFDEHGGTTKESALLEIKNNELQLLEAIK